MAASLVVVSQWKKEGEQRGEGGVRTGVEGVRGGSARAHRDGVSAAVFFVCLSVLYCT